MKKILIILSLIVAIPYALFPAESEMPTNYIPPFSWKDLLKIAPCKNFTTPQKTKIATNLTLLIATLGAFYKDPSIALIPLSVCLAYNNFFYQKTEQSESELEEDDYKYYMGLIKDINDKMYKDFLRAKKVFGIRCIKQHKKPLLKMKKPSYLSKGFHFLFIPEKLRDDSDKEAVSRRLKIEVNRYYKTKFPFPESYVSFEFKLSEEQKLHTLSLIESLDKILYKKILLADPTGEKHILPYDGFAAIHYHTDGLPKIFLSRSFFELPLDQQLFTIGHELGHYALLHVKKIPAETQLLKENVHDFNLLFGALNRYKEYAADEFSLLHCKTSPEAAIELFKTIDNSYKQIDQTHPSAHNRITHFKKLTQNPYIKRTPPPINWDEVITEYKQPTPQTMQTTLYPCCFTSPHY